MDSSEFVSLNSSTHKLFYKNIIVLNSGNITYTETNYLVTALNGFKDCNNIVTDKNGKFIAGRNLSFFDSSISLTHLSQLPNNDILAIGALNSYINGGATKILIVSCFDENLSLKWCKN